MSQQTILNNFRLFFKDIYSFDTYLIYIYAIKEKFFIYDEMQCGLQFNSNFKMAV